MPSSYPSGRFSLIALRTALSAARRSAGSAARYWATVEAVMLATIPVLRSARPRIPTSRDARCLAHGVDEGEDFVRHIGVVLRLHPAAMERVRSLVCERIALYAVDAKDADAPLVNVRAEGADHALTFLLPLVAHTGRKGEDGHAVMAVNGDAHVATETV